MHGCAFVVIGLSKIDITMLVSIRNVLFSLTRISGIYNALHSMKLEIIRFTAVLCAVKLKAAII